RDHAGGNSELFACAGRIRRNFLGGIHAASGQRGKQEIVRQGDIRERYRPERQGSSTPERQRAAGNTREEIATPYVLRRSRWSPFPLAPAPHQLRRFVPAAAPDAHDPFFSVVSVGLLKPKSLGRLAWAYIGA